MNKPWFDLPQPIIALAAMDGVSDTVFRQICREWGADLVFTEFIHSTGLIRSKKYRDPILKYDESERPVIVQIYGNNPDDFYTAALHVLSLGFDGIDINMGCPSKTVAGHGSGCALMRSPELATQIVKNVLKARDEFVKEIKPPLTPSPIGSRTGSYQEGKNKIIPSPSLDKEGNLSLPLTRGTKGVCIPVTVKMRIGYDEIIGPDFAKVLEDAGAEALIVHGRTLKMGYSGVANWDVIGQVAKSVSIPVLGNGDVKTADDVKRALDLGCVGVTIGRASFGNPFIFKEIKEELKGNSWSPTLELRLQTYLKNTKLAFEDNGERGLIESRKHISGYVRSFDGASEIRQKLIFAKSVEEIEEIINNVN